MLSKNLALASSMLDWMVATVCIALALLVVLVAVLPKRKAPDEGGRRGPADGGEDVD